MRTLQQPETRASIESRLASLTPDTPRRWGRMTASRMVCHLTDAFRGVLGERTGTAPARPAPLLGRTIMKWVALYAPLPWPRGLPTAAIADQERGGTPPTSFDADLAALRAVTGRFVRELPAVASRPHFVFGPLTEAQWARWGFRHMDHHLRQFGL